MPIAIFRRFSSHALRAIGAAALACALIAAASTASAQDAETSYLKAFVGDWRGEGRVQLTPSAKVEAVICRVAGELVDASTIEITGRCGGESFTGTFGITARYDPQIDAYRTVFSGPPTVGSLQVVGYRSGDHLELELRKPGQPLSFLTISRHGEGTFRIRANTTTGPTTPPYTSADIALIRQ